MSTLAWENVDSAQVAKVYLAARTPFRTPGVHVSDVIADLVRTVPSLAKVLEQDEATTEAMWMVGLLWESGAVAAGGWGPAAGELDGITGSADILVPVVVDAMSPRVEECKATWKKLRDDIRDDWRWMTQAKSYCAIFGVEWVRFNVLFVNSNYAPPTPAIRRYYLHFTKQEIADNWHMMRTHARYMEARQADVERYRLESELRMRAS